jgi:hypothetical protein
LLVKNVIKCPGKMWYKSWKQMTFCSHNQYIKEVVW